MVAALNSGHVRTCTVADLHGEGRRELIVGGLTNVLGFQWFVARAPLDLEHPGVPPELWEVEQTAAGRPFGYDAYMLLGVGLAAAVTGDRDLAARVGSNMRVVIDMGSSGLLRELAVMRSFLWGEHRRGGDLELEPHPGAFKPAAVLRLWSRLEAGSADDRDIEALERQSGSSGIRDLARLALARHAQLAGRPVEARRVAADAVWNLEQRGRTEWPAAVWWTLGRWVLAEALLDSGEPSAALPNLEAVAAHAPWTFYGRAARERLGQPSAP